MLMLQIKKTLKNYYFNYFGKQTKIIKRLVFLLFSYILEFRFVSCKYILLVLF